MYFTQKNPMTTINTGKINGIIGCPSILMCGDSTKLKPASTTTNKALPIEIAMACKIAFPNLIRLRLRFAMPESQYLLDSPQRCAEPATLSAELDLLEQV